VQLLEHRRGLVFVEPQLQARQRPAHRGGDVRQQVGADCRQQRHAQLARKRLAPVLREHHHLIGRLQDAPRTRHDLDAGLSEGHVVRGALDELHPEALLELLQLRRERRLADEALRRRPPEMTLVGHCDEVAQVLELEFHAANIRYLSIP
jgi:hypothetical protein